MNFEKGFSLLEKIVSPLGANQKMEFQQLRSSFFLHRALLGNQHFVWAVSCFSSSALNRAMRAMKNEGSLLVSAEGVEGLVQRLIRPE
jgi:hypothetical protein